MTMEKMGLALLGVYDTSEGGRKWHWCDCVLLTIVQVGLRDTGLFQFV